MKQQNNNALEATSLDTFLTVKEVSAHVGIGVSTVWKFVRQGEFPRPIKIGQNITRWRLSEVKAWMEQSFPAPR